MSEKFLVDKENMHNPELRAAVALLEQATDADTETLIYTTHLLFEHFAQLRQQLVHDMTKHTAFIVTQGKPRQLFDSFWPVVERYTTLVNECHVLMQNWYFAFADLQRRAPNAVSYAASYLEFFSLIKPVKDALTRFRDAVDPLYDRSEFAMHRLIREHSWLFFPPDVTVSLPPIFTLGTGLPDLWVKKERRLLPVEVKKHRFNARAKYQLLDYMEEYNCPEGFAIAPELTTSLPQNILFVRFDWDDLLRTCYTYYPEWFLDATFPVWLNDQEQ